MENVIRDILNGDKESFRYIIREYREDLLRIAYHFVRNWEEAGDLTQATFIACYRNLPHYDPSRPFRPWLYRLHLNQCKSAYRRRFRNLVRFIRLEEAPPVGVEPPESGDEALILHQIDRLSPRQKAAFILMEIEHCSSLEAAEILGCSDATVRVHLARAKAELRRRLQSLGLGYE